MKPLGSDQPQLLYSVPSLGFDESNGPPTFVFVTYQLALERFPFSFDESTGFFISNGWLGAPGVHHQRVELFKPTGERLLDCGERRFELSQENSPYMAVTFLMGVTFESPGEHRVVVSLDGRSRLTYPFHIVKVAPEGRQGRDGHS